MRYDSPKLLSVANAVRLPQVNCEVKVSEWVSESESESEVKWSVFGPLIFMKLLYVIAGALT